MIGCDRRLNGFLFTALNFVIIHIWIIESFDIDVYHYILPLEMCHYIHTVGVSGTGQSHASVKR